MSRARTDFYESLSSFTYALESSDVISKGLTDVKHNERARLLRNGLSVSGFAMVEEFVKQRTSEILDKIGYTNTPFNELPDGLQTAAVKGVLLALPLQAKFISKNDITAFYQKHAKSVGSTATNPYHISSMALCHGYVNLSADEIEKLLDTFRIEAPWTTLTSIINRLSVGVLVPKQLFEDAAARRHASAHVSNTNTQYSSLESYKLEAISFCLAYDLLISKALRLISSRDNDYLVKKTKISNKNLTLRFIKQSGSGKWKELKVKKGDPRQYITAKVSSDYNQLKTDCLAKGRLDGFAVIHITESGVPLEWFTPDID